jgi:hypothetical protein
MLPLLRPILIRISSMVERDKSTTRTFIYGSTFETYNFHPPISPLWGCCY